MLFAAVIAVARAGILGSAAYSAAPAVSYSSISAPALYGGPGLSYGAAPALSYAAPALSYAAPIAKTIIAEPEAPAHYDFGYAVNDPHTGDSKSQQESRRGDAVQGKFTSKKTYLNFLY